MTFNLPGENDEVHGKVTKDVYQNGDEYKNWKEGEEYKCRIIEFHPDQFWYKVERAEEKDS